MEKSFQTLKRLIPNLEFFARAKEAQIDFTNAMLKNDKFAPIPDDYAMFLKDESNGMVCGMLEFFGTEKVKRADYNYNFPSIIDANEIFKTTNNMLMENSVLLGYNLLYAIIWNESEKVYKIINRNFFTPLETFTKFDDVLKFIISKYED
ncbi:MAG: hypothetical protein ACI4N3_04525 [Alphaproteobacteria bacterium]